MTRRVPLVIYKEGEARLIGEATIHDEGIDIVAMDQSTGRPYMLELPLQFLTKKEISDGE